jgi:PEP-CTERM/exosortase A-associated glycosyltransferase
MGIHVAVVTSAQQPQDGNDPIIEGIRYYRTPKLRLLPSPVRELQLMAALRSTVEAAAHEFKPDVIHAHSPILVGQPAIAVARTFGIPFVYEVRDLWENALVDRGRFKVNSLPYRVARFLETRLLRNADAVVTIGDTLLSTLGARTNRKIFRVRNGVDTNQFRPLVALPEWRAAWNTDGRTTIAYIGSFQPYEGLPILIEALPLIAKDFPNVQLLVAGDGPERAQLEKLAKRLDIQGQVQFVGRIPHDRVAEIYAVADVLIYPRIDSLTTRLTTPLKPLEAMAMGKAVVASDLDALRELIEDGRTGLLFVAGSAQDLAAKVVTLLASETLRQTLGQAATDEVCATRTWAAEISQYRNVYDF